MGSDTSPFIDDQTRAQFEADGVICLRSVIGEDWRRMVADGIEAALLEPGPFDHGYEGGGGRFFAESRRWQVDPCMADYIFHSPLPALAAALLQSDPVHLLYDQIFAKEPGTPTRTPWHNDISAWPLRGSQVVSFWLPLDPVARFHLGNGAVVHAVHAGADTSDKGLAQSGGTVVNYLYDLPRVAQNHEVFANTREILADNRVKSLAASADLKPQDER